MASENVSSRVAATTHPYDALSYWWGDDEAQNEISINSYEPHKTSSQVLFL